MSNPWPGFEIGKSSISTPRSYRSFARTAADFFDVLSSAWGSSLSVTMKSRLDEKLGALVVKIWFVQKSTLAIDASSVEGTISLLNSSSSSTRFFNALTSSAAGTSRSVSR